MRFTFPDGIEKDAGFLEGHFVGNPIVPGAIFLGYAAAGLRDHGYEFERLMRIKFLRKLLPCVPFEITCKIGQDTSMLTWVSAGDVLAKAQVRLRPTGG